MSLSTNACAEHEQQPFFPNDESILWMKWLLNSNTKTSLTFCCNSPFLSPHLKNAVLWCHETKTPEKAILLNHNYRTWNVVACLIFGLIPRPHTSQVWVWEWDYLTLKLMGGVCLMWFPHSIQPWTIVATAYVLSAGLYVSSVLQTSVCSFFLVHICVLACVMY